MNNNQKQVKTKSKRSMDRKEYISAVKREMRENRKSWIVFCVLRVLVICSMVRQLLLANYEGFALCLLTLLLLIVPSMIQVSLHVDISQTLEIIIMCFIFAAEILGEVDHYYTAIPFWDTILHTLNGFLAAAVGFSLVLILNKNENIMFDLSPLYIAIVAFCFSMTIGVVWEFFEFGMDMMMGLDMQKDTVVNSISSIMLDPTHSQVPTSIKGITSTVVNGKELGLGGYLDIGLIDTMEDLFVNFIGALVFSTVGYLALKGGEKQKKLADRFSIRRK